MMPLQLMRWCKLKRELRASLGISSGGEVKVASEVIQRLVTRQQLADGKSFAGLKQIWGNYR